MFSIISDTFCNKSIEQDPNKKNWLIIKILYHEDERYRIALAIIIIL